MEEFSVDEGVQVAIDAIGQMIASREKPIIVQIAGGSGSGKTTMIADKIKEAFGNSAALLPMDDYFKGRGFVEKEIREGREMNRDHPDYVDMEKFSQDIKALKKKQQIQKPIFDYVKSARVGYAPFSSKSIIIIEGLFALHDKISGAADLRIFVESSKEERLKRILARKRLVGGVTLEGQEKYFHEVLEPMHAKYVAPTKARADIVIRN